MIKIYHKTIKDTELKELKRFKIGSWLHVEKPKENELNYLAKNFSIDFGLLKDAIDPYEVPRFEIDKKGIFVFTRAPWKDEKGRVFTSPLLIAVGEDFVLTLSYQHSLFSDKFINNKTEFSTTQKTKLFLQFFSEIIYSYNHFLIDINRNVRAVSVQLEKITDKNIAQFVSFENIVNDFLAALVPTNTILNNLLSASSRAMPLELYEKDRDLIEDLSLSGNQLVELCRSTLKTIVNIRESYSAIVANSLSRVMKFLTALTVIITLPVAIAGFYGMNVSLPFSKSPLAFWYIVIGNLILALVLLVVFIKKKWL
ncbi:magnesium transporter CorA family protein [Candidatus Wolfebacteria bacterium]|nr:magnesium transporter CorA family protein [Candidatus Wolfebacteria bacterium]